MMLDYHNINNNYPTTATEKAVPLSNTLYHHPQSRSLDIDGVDHFDSESVASSPHSTQSALLPTYPFQSTPHSTVFAPLRSLTVPANSNSFTTTTSSTASGLDLSQVPELMPSADQWLLHGQQQTPRAALRLGHHRESSLSSLGSNGPASPYNQNTSNPHIAVTDSSSDAFQDMSGGDANYSYHSGKPLGMNDNFYATLHNYNGSAHGTGSIGTSFADGLSSMSTQDHRPRMDRNLLPAPELSIGSASRSHPVSVASSIAGGDSPATPSYQEPEEDGRRRKNVFNNNIPKLDRTMTDIYSDELYSPNFTITSASPPSQTLMAMSPSNDLFAQRLQAANSQHLNAVHSPVSMASRNQSPFRQGSPLAPTLHDFSQAGSQAQLNSAQQIREKRKAQQDAQVLQQQMARHAGSQQQQQQGTPSTISPKDAMLEFNDADDAANFPLFPVQETNSFGLGQVNKLIPQQQQQQQHATQVFQSTTPLQSAFNFDMPTNIPLPQQYPFVARPRQHAQQQVTPSVSTFSRMSSADTNSSDASATSGHGQRPARTNADGGTYTCTYHGCTQRFETPALLQKHKREGHRQTNALNVARAPAGVPVSTGSPEALFNTQAGPHRCDRINPSTGKPCNTVFSRPYDLTRHEDTIHNARKQKVRCNLCTEEKTFSRADALTRHYRVCHPDVEFPGKHRRRGGSAA